jgi:hypothetical protein
MQLPNSLIDMDSKKSTSSVSCRVQGKRGAGQGRGEE